MCPYEFAAVILFHTHYYTIQIYPPTKIGVIEYFIFLSGTFLGTFIICECEVLREMKQIKRKIDVGGRKVVE